LHTQYAKEIWKLYETGNLNTDVVLTGQFKSSTKKADVRSVLREIDDAREEALSRRFDPANHL